MKIRNAKFTVDGKVDCEVDHPVHGWIPYCAAEDDLEPFGQEVWAAVGKAKVKPYTPPQPTKAQVNAECDRRVCAALGVDTKLEAVIRQMNGGKAVATKVKAIVAASNALTKKKSIPVDFADDAHWPS